MSSQAAAGANRRTPLRGTVDRIAYRDEASGYTVLRLAGTPGGPVTAVGRFVSVTPGESLRLWGEWTSHPTYGPQFKVEAYQSETPATLAGITRYLGSGLIKGIGPATAERLVRAFGADTLWVIEHEPERLREIDGIGPKKAEAIARGLGRQRAVHEVMVFLQGHGISPAYAARIYRQYGDQAIAAVRQNPYRLATDIAGIGFQSADRIARRLGVTTESAQRMAAGIEHVLQQAAGEGHACLPDQALREQAAALLGVPAASLGPILDNLAREGRVIAQPFIDRPGETAVDRTAEMAVYLPGLYRAEAGVAARLAALARSTRPVALLEPADEVLRAAQEASGITLSPTQRQAVVRGLYGGALVITGGPGTGKTTILRVLLACLLRRGERVALACPTGRAAQRLKEATGYDARTVHRLLEFGHSEGEGPGFQHHAARPLDADVVVVDEASMVDLWLAHHLLAALRPGARLILVGDADQLPSVGPGHLLRDVIRSGVVEVVRLTEIFRQARQSAIVLNAHRVRMGQGLILNGPQRDFFFIEEEDPERIASTVCSLATERLPAFLACEPIEGVQVLSPMRRGATGVEQLNRLLQERLNPAAADKPELAAGAHRLRLGDKVMQLRNNYRKLVFNGDIGRVRHLDPEAGEVTVAYPQPDGEQAVPYDAGELDELAPAYCISVHKSQGSEYPAVVVPVTTQHYVMLQRNLLYTAITRARRLVVLVGSRRALRRAVQNEAVVARHSQLSAALRAASS